MKTIVFFLGTFRSLQAQDSLTTTPFTPTHAVFVGLKLPLNYTVGYRFQFSRRLSVQAEAGLIAAPFNTYTLKTMQAFGLDPTLSTALDHAFQPENSASIGINVHTTSP